MEDKILEKNIIIEAKYITNGLQDYIKDNGYTLYNNIKNGLTSYEDFKNVFSNSINK